MSTTRDIYQQIYDVDIAQAGGIRAVTKSEQGNASQGYIVVDEAGATAAATKLFQPPVIPLAKRKSYALAEALFDNYDLLSSVRDDITTDEQAEVDELLAYVVESAPVRLARDYIATNSGRALSDAAWYTRVNGAWFRPFRTGAVPSRSGFEHVFLGDRKARKDAIGGLHWWYFYVAKMADLRYVGARYNIAHPESGLAVPDVVTMSFEWRVDGRTLSKPVGGFFVGPSVEGLMAMAMVRASRDAAPPSTAVIEGVEVDMVLGRSGDGLSIDTFYPRVKRVLVAAGPAPARKPVAPPTDGGPDVTTTTPGRPTVPPAARGLRIIAAVSNPAGPDEGRERITLLKVGSGGGDAAPISLAAWAVRGPNGSELVFGDVVLAVGEARTFAIPARGSLQLGNQGGAVSLRAPGGAVAQTVTYDREVASVQGGVLVWDGAGKLILMAK